MPDQRSIVGLEGDYASLRKEGKDDRDVFQLHRGNIISASMGAAVAANVTVQIHTVDERDTCRIHVHPSGFPVDAKVTIDRNGQHEKKTLFFVRTGNSTRSLDEEQKQKYIVGRWPGRG